ncbi:MULTISPECIES: efflux RND transporter permease subunit [unclassified Methylophaga]|jgi:cobalt-zinc-cadmium resistance protein CzcA|uniref:efflux RND transporter permease subunit n=1 Tax=unclassified Methylophaga TaxID=2629249 RepID=UPI000C63550C|nr:MULTISPECIES: CusA/CzcA family heavy metal efflux RND transporter [unclassified Methylophaga]MAL50885.1 CusA/CzcA family heavy metal efflux RND transporter [Methylophaga sp.]MAM29586.1 CusA/CzcA family heavy metal efflux RND transporter [Flavobacteriaceae bacterium]MBP23815.1 CusA/CzcA family heavy metal efflux RND transporter [Methylophaga sp.]HCC80026.1 CusA/CzcA family heavy metal efflux RND transporter [Methylophaga sp.]|tara:strand:- start:2544 stop:5648 length:3105 start_codon:yes stop_codon:yes gene_type:complete
MLDTILRASLNGRSVIMALVLFISILGIWNFNRLPIDAVPDITNVQVVINTEAPGYTPLEVEQRVTFPIETAMAGLPNLEYTRSVSRYGLSQVTIIFSDDTDIYFARQLVNERLTNVRTKLQASLNPELGPMATGLGEIFMFTVDALPGATKDDGTAITPTDLRTAHDWIIRPQLLRVPGVVEVNPIGGFKREVLIAMKPEKLLFHEVSQQELIDAISDRNQNRGVGFVEKKGAQLLLRVPGQANNLEEIGNILVKPSEKLPVRVKDLANVEEGKELRSGAATQNGREVVMSTVFMLVGENSRTVAKGVAEKLEVINASLPEGIVAKAVYDRTKLVDKTLKTVQTNLLEGALLVIVILFFLLGNFRAALLTAAVIPIAMLMTISGMVQTRVSANLMSLGALDFGLLVDGAIIIVENCLRRLGIEAKQGKTLSLSERLDVVYNATREVIRPAMFGVFIITAVYLPIFSLTGVEGKMFHPMAITVVIALVSSMILSITFVPAAIAFLFKKPLVEKESKTFNALQNGYQWLLIKAIKVRWLVILLAGALVALSGWYATQLGSEFVPNLDEGDIAMHALRIPGTSLSQSIEFQKILESRIKELPEVQRVFAKIGTADVATDAVPPSVADNFIILKPRSEWPNPDKLKSEVVADLETLVSDIPGNRYEFLQPIQMRFNELLSGVRAELAIKVFGDDLDLLAEVGRNIEEAISDVEDIVDVQVEQTKGLPFLAIEPKFDVMSRYGVSLDMLQDQLAIAIGGQVSGLFYEGDRSFDITVRLPEERRTDLDSLGSLPIQVTNQRYVPLMELVEFSYIDGLNQVNRENGKRRVVVTANVRGRDLGSFVEDVKRTVSQRVDIPAGYWVEYGGTYQSLQSASNRLMVVVPATLFMIIGLLLLALRSFKDAMVIFTGVPLALTGGVLALVLRDIPFSISAAVGFIALSGIAILNGLVMLSFIRELMKEGIEVTDAIVKGAMTRLRPVITTAFVASLGFVPMALNTGIGSEVQRPLATVVIGGVISSTLLTLFVLPALYRIVQRTNK